MADTSRESNLFMLAKDTCRVIHGVASNKIVGLSVEDLSGGLVIVVVLIYGRIIGCLAKMGLNPGHRSLKMNLSHVFELIDRENK